MVRSDLLEKYGPCALVTGASSGIGTEFARQLAAHGFDLVITARRKDRLEQLSEALQGEFKIKVTVVELDLVKDGCVEKLVEATKHLEIGLLINNAGMALSGAFMKNEAADCEKLIALNVTAVTLLARTFGRMMCERNRGGILFVSSIASKGSPYLSVYSASKAFVTCLGTLLREEMRPFNVEIMVLEPGFVLTEMTSKEKRTSSAVKANAMMLVDECVETALGEFGSRGVCTPGLVYQMAKLLASILPRSFRLWVLAKFIRYSSNGEADRY